MRDPENPLVSSIFFMCLPDKVLVYGDCAVVVNPSSKDLAQIAISSADTAAAFNIKPRVAMLSYSTGASGSGPEVERVAEAVNIVSAFHFVCMLHVAVGGRRLEPRGHGLYLDDL